jgi:hypothetical protein
MKVLVCGGRDFNNREFVNRVLSEQHRIVAFTHLIHGACSGADTLANEWALANGVQPVACEALWKHYRGQGKVKAAGPIRNRRMLELDPHLVIAFPGGGGTQGMVDLASEANIQVYRPAVGEIGGR